MPQPTPNQLHVDTYLTGMMIPWAQSNTGFVATQVFPTVPVQKESDLFAIYKRGFFYRDELRPRPIGGRPPEIGYEVESGRYHATEWGAEHKIDDRVRANADAPLDPDMAAMRLLTTQALIRREKIWASSFFKTGVWSADWEGAASASGKKFQYWNAEKAEPIAFIKARKLEMAAATGYIPNVLVLGPEVLEALSNSPAVIERIKYTERGIITEDILAALFGIEKIVVPMGVVNSAQEGKTESTGFIINAKQALLAYAPPAPSLMEPSAGYTFAYTGLIPGATNAMGGVIERGREELAHSDVFQIRAAYDMQVTAKELGIFFDKAVE